MIGWTIFHPLYWTTKTKERNRGDQISRHFLDQSEETKNRNVLNVFASSFDLLIELRASVIDWYIYVVLVSQITTNNWDEVQPNLQIYFYH